MNYQQEKEQNERAFWELFQKVAPDDYVIIDLKHQMGTSSLVLMKIMRQIYNLAIGSGWGRIVTIMQDKKITTIQGEDTDKVNEPATTNNNT